MSHPTVPLVCSFCGQRRTAGAIQSRHGAVACAPCIKRLNHAITTEDGPNITDPLLNDPTPGTPLQDGLQYLTALNDLSDQNRAVRDQLAIFLHDHRRASWTDIATALGITRQAAWDRYAPRNRPIDGLDQT